MKKVDTPELEKLAAVRHQVISGFLDWLREIVLAEWSGRPLFHYRNDGDEHMIHMTQTKEQLLANYFEIDLAKCEEERRALLDALRADGR